MSTQRRKSDPTDGTNGDGTHRTILQKGPKTDERPPDRSPSVGKVE